MAKQVRKLHLMHASMQFTDSRAQFGEDIRVILSREPDILSLTEMTNHWSYSRDTVQKLGYRYVINKANDTMHAVKQDKNIKIKGSSLIPVLPGNAGVHHAKYVTTVCVDWYGETIYHHVMHWVSPRWGKSFPAKHEKMTDALITKVKLDGKGGKFSFFAGDVNDDDDEKDAITQWNKKFRANGLTTIWDEFKVHPGTHAGNRTIDIIGSYDKDKRVKGARYKVWPRLNTDHRPISAWYDVTVGDTATTTSNSTKPGKKPTAADKSGNQKDDDPYATGGNVSWADYAGNDAFDLPSAVDDSDQMNG